MKPLPKQILAVCGLTAVVLGAVMAFLKPEQPDRTTEAATKTTQPKTTTEAQTTFGWSEEYDYQAPEPGTYELPVLQDASDGTVVAPDGKPVRLHKLLDGRVAILSFIYTRCSDPRACLRASGVLSELQQLSRQDPAVQAKLQLITLSFDPGYDTPEVMQRYGQVFSHDEAGANWLFLTTRNNHDLQPLLEAYGQRVDKRAKPSALGPYQHTLRVYLIDSQKRIRNIYSYGLLDPRLVMADVQTLLREEKGVAQD
jgi:cytochrome oxidase Cu insertion factor (SCO1/SenC/PrrC family)